MVKTTDAKVSSKLFIALIHYVQVHIVTHISFLGGGRLPQSEMKDY